MASSPRSVISCGLATDLLVDLLGGMIINNRNSKGIVDRILTGLYISHYRLP